MNDVCDPLSCPFAGCASCEYAGGAAVPERECAPTGYGRIGSTKTAPDRCANTAEGLTTNDRVGVVMATPDATPLTGSAAAKIDGCPSCVINAEAPYAGFTDPAGALVCMYHCADCGHRWHTSWSAVA